MKNFLYLLSLCLSIQNHILIIDEADIPEIQKALSWKAIHAKLFTSPIMGEGV